MTARTVYERLTEVIAEHLAVDAAQIVRTASLAGDLAADSLDIVDLAWAIEVRFAIDISDDELATLRTVGDALALVERKLAAKQ